MAGTGADCCGSGHAFAWHRVQHPFARQSPPATWPGQGLIAAPPGHAFAGQRVQHPIARPSPAAPRPGQGRIAAAMEARIRRAEGGAPCRAPESTGAMAGMGADCCGSTARIRWAKGGAPCGAALGAPESAGATAGTEADYCGSGARNGGGCAEGCGGIITKSTPPGGALACGFGFARYLLLGIHFGAISRSALCVRDARCAVVEELEIGTSRRSLGSLQGGLRREQ